MDPRPGLAEPDKPISDRRLGEVHADRAASRTVPVTIQIVGEHRAGKTVTLVRVLRALRRRGLAVGVLKHSDHAIDLRGKDTDRFRRGGAEAVVFASDRLVAFLPGDPVAFARRLPVDVLLVEGYRSRRVGHRFEIASPAESRRVAAGILRYLDGRLGRTRPRARK